MTPKLYQCQYEKATKCAMDLPCLGCETHAKYAARSIVKFIKNSEPEGFEKVSEKTADGLGPLKIDLDHYEWRREVSNVGSHYQPILAVGRTLVKVDVKYPFPVSDKSIYAVSVNGVWYEESPLSKMHDELWENLKK